MGSNWLPSALRFGDEETINITDGVERKITDDESSALLLTFTGALTAAGTARLPVLVKGRHYAVQNATTGGYLVNLLAPTGSTGVAIPSGSPVNVIVNRQGSLELVGGGQAFDLSDPFAGSAKGRRLTVARRFTSTTDDPIDVQVVGNIAPVLGVESDALPHSIVFVRVHALVKRSGADEEFSKACTRAYRVDGSGALTALGAQVVESPYSFASAGASGTDISIGSAGAKIVITAQPIPDQTWRWQLFIEASYVTDSA